ncbi:BON domain-containing protein [Legionella cardiaca]|uniref:BON domain-containing protein n=1 Tax=Legionella cardiaca TaxID=1071983 RepID=A0ABY8ARV5_9GAMM|nr:BON domain-containing protein [Legionella cardiaca]WED42941.1 BON domain-containing protein [Legionella cardiaca]
MKKQGNVVFILLLSSCLLTGCISNVWTGAMLVYDRHNVYKKISDYELAAKVHHELYFEDRLLEQKGCVIDVAVFNGDVLLAGHVPTVELRDAAIARVSKLSDDYRRLFNQMDINNYPGNSVQDSWITTKIRGKIFADSSIDPNVFKVVTSDRIVYLMGDVPAEQAEKVINIARKTNGVIRVVKLLKYYHLTDKATLNS